jgi:hypothetical protein
LRGVALRLTPQEWSVSKCKNDDCAVQLGSSGRMEWVTD